MRRRTAVPVIAAAVPLGFSTHLETTQRRVWSSPSMANASPSRMAWQGTRLLHRAEPASRLSGSAPLLPHRSRRRHGTQQFADRRWRTARRLVMGEAYSSNGRPASGGAHPVGVFGSWHRRHRSLTSGRRSAFWRRPSSIRQRHLSRDRPKCAASRRSDIQHRTKKIPVPPAFRI